MTALEPIAGLRPVLLARPEPLTAVAVVARGAAAAALVRTALSRTDEALGELSGVAGPDSLLLLGPTQALPWCDGALYLGCDEQCPSLLLPTTRMLALEGVPSVQPGVVQRALLRAAGPGGPWAVLPPLSMVSTAQARPVERALLEQFLREGL